MNNEERITVLIILFYFSVFAILSSFGILFLFVGFIHINVMLSIAFMSIFSFFIGLIAFMSIALNFRK